MSYAKASKTLAAAGDYAAGDVLSEDATDTEGTAWQWIGFKPREIIGARAYCSEDSVTFRLRIHLFGVNPAASELDDNAARALDNDDRDVAFGYIDLPAFSDMGEYAMAGNGQLAHAIHAGGWDLYGIVEAVDAEANETASMVLEVELMGR